MVLHFRNHGIHIEVILDEGSIITTGMVPSIRTQSAVIAVQEKSRHIYRRTLQKSNHGYGGSPVFPTAFCVCHIDLSKDHFASIHNKNENITVKT